SAYKADEFRFYLEDAGARTVITVPETHPVQAVARELGLPLWSADRDGSGRVRLHGDKLPGSATAAPRPQPDDGALLLHTSGPTSRPKGVPLTHANLLASIRNISAHYRLMPEDIGLVAMPLFHVHGLIGATLSSLFAGATIIVPPRFSAQAFWPAVQAH